MNEKWYYFTTSGLAGGNTKNTDPLYKEGKTYLFDDDGAYIPAEDYPQGWSMIGENWYYKDGENFVTGTVKQINGDWYVFNFHGKMINKHETLAKEIIYLPDLDKNLVEKILQK